VEDEAENRDEDAGIRDVKRRPGVRERDVKIEERKIDDMTVPETIGEIAHNTGVSQKRATITQSHPQSIAATERRGDNDHCKP
jgi:hypothetical protein